MVLLVLGYRALEAVRREIKQTRLKTVFFFVPLGAGMVIDILVRGE